MSNIKKLKKSQIKIYP